MVNIFLSIFKTCCVLCLGIGQRSSRIERFGGIWVAFCALRSEVFLEVKERRAV